MFARVENGLTTKVASGENNGRTLMNDAVVRELRRIGRTRNGTTTLALAQSGVVFVQDPQTMRILAAATVP
jgi:hypothetical protein